MFTPTSTVQVDIKEFLWINAGYIACQGISRQEGFNRYVQECCDVRDEQGRSDDRSVPLSATPVATVIGNDGQPAGRKGEAEWRTGLRRRGLGV